MRATAVFLILAVAGTASDPVELVKKLGAPRYAQREQAAVSLESLGREALPALRAARQSRDAEIRTRASGLVERIENDLMVRPTMVALDFRDVPEARVAEAIGARAGVLLSRSDGAPAFGARTVTLESPAPVPFWQAIDEFALASGLELDTTALGLGMTTGPDHRAVIPFFPVDPGAARGPTSVSGPFRIALLSLTHDRDRQFVAGNHGMIVLPEPPGAPAAPLPAHESFVAQLQIQAEPRMSAALRGPVQILEAIDDRGQSLQATAAPDPAFQHQSGYNRMEMPGGSSIQVALPLKYPEEPGRVIRRLRGRFAATVSSRKDEPLTIALAESRGRSFRTSESLLTVQDVRPDAQAPDQAILVELTLRPLEPTGAPGFGAETFQVRTPGGPQNQLEFADAEGRVLTQWHLASEMHAPDGVRISVRVIAAAGVPAQMRFYDLARAETEATFEFSDVDMP